MNNTTVTAVPTTIDIEYFSPAIMITLKTLMVTVTVIGLTGNGLVCYFFATKRVQSTPFNLLLLNLSIADIMADIFTYLQIFVGFDLKLLRNLRKSVADFACAFTIGVVPFSIACIVSIFTLTFISINRYVFVKYPLKTAWFKKKRNTVAFIILSWLFATAVMIPNIFSFDFDVKFAVCYRKTTTGLNQLAYGAISFLLFFLIPMVVMIVTFIVTARRLWNSSVPTSGQRSGQESDQNKGLQKKRDAVKLLGMLILLFYACWFPTFVYLVLSTANFFPDGIEGERIRMKIIPCIFLVRFQTQ